MKTPLVLLFMFAFLLNLTPAIAGSGLVKKKDISYVDKSASDFDKVRHSLDIVSPENAKDCDVVIFIHGGSWNSGSKNSYRRIGSNFAGKNIVFVSINYRLSPEANYKEMAYDVARAIKWVQQNISQYGGNPDRIFLSGHSAGGYLAALVGLDPKYFQQAGVNNNLKGLILIDAFCLDLYDFFTITDPEFAKRYYPIFGSLPVDWQEATPLNYLNKTKIPMQAFLGTKTYPGILLGTDRFRSQCVQQGKQLELNIIQGKKHVGMITQMFFRRNKMFNYIIDFMKRY